MFDKRARSLAKKFFGVLTLTTSRKDKMGNAAAREEKDRAEATRLRQEAETRKKEVEARRKEADEKVRVTIDYRKEKERELGFAVTEKHWYVVAVSGSECERPLRFHRWGWDAESICLRDVCCIQPTVGPKVTTMIHDKLIMIRDTYTMTGDEAKTYQRRALTPEEIASFRVERVRGIECDVQCPDGFWRIGTIEEVTLDSITVSTKENALYIVLPHYSTAVMSIGTQAHKRPPRLQLDIEPKVAASVASSSPLPHSPTAPDAFPEQA
jgi:hypothetical protein